jgi:mono/diheme cytochrome c family protein
MQALARISRRKLSHAQDIHAQDTKVGRTPWSARGLLDPLFALKNQPHSIPERPARGPAADQGVRPTFCATAILGLLAFGVAAQTTRSVWDGVYSDEQSKRGAALYAKQCASCHGSELTGGESAPALVGDAFLSNWNGTTVGDLFERIRKSMPQDDPGRLSRQQNADILAFMLNANKFPVGKADLDRETEVLKLIKFETK